jgi:hypothetical protein
LAGLSVFAVSYYALKLKGRLKITLICRLKFETHRGNPAPERALFLYLDKPALKYSESEKI